jgi:hypothetical protein
MADRFQILVHINDESAHFKLIGKFDDRAVSELIDSLRMHSGGASKIFIHTDSLDEIASCNEQNFKNRLYGSNGLAAKILSTGRFSNIFSAIEGRPF